MLRDRLSEEARLAAGGADGPAGEGGGGGEGPSRQHLMGLAAIGKEQVEEIVVTYRTLQDPLALSSSSSASSLGQPAAAAFPLSSYSRLMPSLTREQTAVVCRWLVANSALGRARGTVLKWLVDAGDKQVSGTTTDHKEDRRNKLSVHRDGREAVCTGSFLAPPPFSFPARS